MASDEPPNHRLRQPSVVCATHIVRSSARCLTRFLIDHERRLVLTCLSYKVSTTFYSYNTTLTSLSWHDLAQIRVQRVSSMQCGRSLYVTFHPKCWSRTTVLGFRVGSSERSRSYGTSSMSRAAHDTRRAMDKLKEPSKP